MKNLTETKVGDYLGIHDTVTGEVNAECPLMVARIRKTRSETWLEGPDLFGMVRSVNVKTGQTKHCTRGNGHDNRFRFCLLPMHADAHVPALVEVETPYSKKRLVAVLR